MARQLELAETLAPETISITGDEVRAVSPEGQARSLKLVELLERVAPRTVDTCDVVLPDGIKCVIPVPGGAIYAHQTTPRLHRFQWIAVDSPAPFGPETTYRQVSLALPYVIVLAVFDGAPGSVPRLSSSSECFFSNRPLDADGLDTPLCFPALLNCSRFADGDASKPLSWICVQHLPASEHEGADTPGRAVRKGLDALLRHLLESGFNRSSEHHEVSSWFAETVQARVDPRLASVEAWEAASAGDQLFALEVPWLPTGRTLGEVAQRIADARGGARPRVQNARDVMRVLFQRRKGAR